MYQFQDVSTETMYELVYTVHTHIKRLLCGKMKNTDPLLHIYKEYDEFYRGENNKSWIDDSAKAITLAKEIISYVFSFPDYHEAFLAYIGDGNEKNAILSKEKNTIRYIEDMIHLVDFHQTSFSEE